MRPLPNLSHHLEKLPYFCVVANIGSIYAAARQLKITQPSLSKSMKNLEEALEVNLFRRSSEGVQLTTEGAVLYRFASQLLEGVMDTTNRLANIGPVRPSIRIATHELFVASVIPNLVKALADSGIKYNLELATNSSSAKLLDMLVAGDVDVALIVEAKAHRAVLRLPIVKDGHRLFATHKYLMKHSLSVESSLSDIQARTGVSLIYAPQVTATASLNVEECLAERGIALHSAYMVSSIESVSALVNHSLGIGLLPDHFGRHLRTKGVVALNVDFGGERTLGALSLYACHMKTFSDSHGLVEKIAKWTRKAF